VKKMNFTLTTALMLSTTPVYAAHYLEVKLTTSALAVIPEENGFGIPVDHYYNFKTMADIVLNMADYPIGSEYLSASPAWEIIDASYSSSWFNLFLEDRFDPSLYFDGHIPLSGLDLSTVFSQAFHGVGSYYATYLINGQYDLTGSVSGPINNVLVRTFDSDATIPSSVTASQSLTPLAAPEPASWAMLVGGFGMIGGAMRRRRVAVRFA